MRASRLVELLVRLQLRGAASAPELAEALQVSVRTVYRDIAALSTAGVPVYTETGRNGGIRIDPAYRIAGLPRLDPGDARGLLFAAVPGIAHDLGLDPAAAEHILLPAMEQAGESAARAVRDRLLIEPTHWFLPPDDAPAVAEVAAAVWDSRETRLDYRGRQVLVRPLGMILKGERWYLLALARGRDSPEREPRLFRLSRVERVEVLPHRFDRPPDFDLVATWTRLREQFLGSIPEFPARVRVAPAAEPLLGLLEEGRPDQLPLPADVTRDEEGWAVLTLRFERPARAVRQLLRLGASVEVLDPPELRSLMVDAVRDLAERYGLGREGARGR